jgi:hypothetical protein
MVLFLKKESRKIKKQGHMFQRKDRDKSPGTNPNGMQICVLCEREFKRTATNGNNQAEKYTILNLNIQ